MTRNEWNTIRFQRNIERVDKIHEGMLDGKPIDAIWEFVCTDPYASFYRCSKCKTINVAHFNFRGFVVFCYLDDSRSFVRCQECSHEYGIDLARPFWNRGNEIISDVKTKRSLKNLRRNFFFS
jgi:hypothetical protein